MREEQEVREKFRELRDRYLQERKQKFLSRCPINCVHNVRLRVKGKGQLGFCQNPLVLSRASGKMFLCNDEDTARRCRVFSPKNTAESVERDFVGVLSSPSMCGREYPKLAMLIWFLQDIRVSGRLSRLWAEVRKVFISLFRILFLRWL